LAGPVTAAEAEMGNYSYLRAAAALRPTIEPQRRGMLAELCRRMFRLTFPLLAQWAPPSSGRGEEKVGAGDRQEDGSTPRRKGALKQALRPEHGAPPPCSRRT
jgi:hypothetical protein